MRLLEVVTALTLVGVLIACAMGVQEALASARYSDAEAYARRVASSVLAAVMAQPYGGSYDLSEVPNPRGWPVSLQVSYYSPGSAPAFSPLYPDAGLQLVEVSVSDLAGRERARLAVLKSR